MFRFGSALDLLVINLQAAKDLIAPARGIPREDIYQGMQDSLHRSHKLLLSPYLVSYLSHCLLLNALVLLLDTLSFVKSHISGLKGIYQFCSCSLPDSVILKGHLLPTSTIVRLCRDSPGRSVCSVFVILSAI